MHGIAGRWATGAAAVLMTLTLTSTPANAAVGDSGKCRPAGDHGHTNDWHVFWSKKVRAYDHVCERLAAVHGVNFMYLAYVATPRVSFPSAWPIPSGEKVSMTREPHVIYKGYQDGKLIAVTYGFSAKSCTTFCTDWDFKDRITRGYTQLCLVGGSCDKRMAW